MRPVVVAVAWALCVAPALAKGGHGGGGHSHSGGGGHSGGGHSSGGHSSGGHSSSSGHAQARTGGSTSSHVHEDGARSGSHGALPPSLADAEHRHPRPGTGTGGRFFRPYGSFYARPYFGLGFRYPFYGGYDFDPFFLYGGYGYRPYGDAYGYGPYGHGYGYGDYGYGDVSGYGYGGYARDYGAPVAPPVVEDDGTVELNVRPYDAAVYVDGEPRGIAEDAGSLRLGQGRHRIELVRPGYQPTEREVEVEAGETRELTIEMSRSPGS